MSSEYIFGIHDTGGEEHLRAARKTGWVVFSEVVGHDPNDLAGKDYSFFSRYGLGVIVCLNNGYFPQGTLPLSSEYSNFARRCANFVRASEGCSRWVIGNEMNYSVGRPGTAEGLALRKHVGDARSGDPTLRSLPERFSALLDAADRAAANEVGEGEELITPQLYANCYRMCREAIHGLEGHEEDQVLIGAVAPWNAQTVYPGNPKGDWIKYFQDILLQCGASGCDGITLHTYTHGANPTLILDNSKLPDYPKHHCHFQAYRDFMHAIPVNMRRLPVYITETDQGGPWENVNRGWIQAAYAEIDRWNRQNAQKIQAMALYRWPQLDRWHISGKEGVIEDFRVALRHDYRWNIEAEQSEAEGRAERRAERREERRGARAVPGWQEADVTEEMKMGRGMVYRVQWMKGKPPSPLYPGQRVVFPVTVRNTGTIAWPAEGPQRIALGYHFFQNRKELPFPDDRPVLTKLTQDVGPGETVTFDAQLVIPDRPGNYTLVLDLVRGGETWFQEMQSDILTRWLNVSEGQPPGGEAGRGEAYEADAGGAVGRMAEAAPETIPPVPVRREARAAAAAHGPAVVDIASSLPRGENPFALRTVDQIRRLVICHTSAPAGVPIQTIAQAHISQGYPGIAYHYFVLESGEILQAAPVEGVVNDEAEWSLTGVNICLEGNFDEDVPRPAQLTATARLCAWMLPRFQLTAQNVVGMSELLETTSPGRTFEEGPAWKRTLHEKVVQLLTDSPLSPPAGAGEVEAPIVQDEGQAAVGPERAPAPRPPIEDVVARLPRDPQRIIQRTAGDVEFIVINHTAAPPITPLQTIAAAFHRRLPGILYQFFIASNGGIYQTQPLLEAVDGEVPYIARAINIGFAGEFNDEIPTPAQISSGRQLIAWLMEAFPQLTLASIRGVNEFINHTSPGEQWLQGRRWKDILLDAVRRGDDGPAAPDRYAAVIGEPGVRERTRSSGEQGGGEGSEEGRAETEESEARARPKPGERVARPQIRDIGHALPRHPTLEYRRRLLAGITHIAVHHTALPPHVGPERIAQTHVEENPARGKRAWPGIGYHYFIPADGEILQTQPVEVRSHHVDRHNSYAIGVAFAGSFMNGSTPTPQQIHSGARLIAWLLQEFELQTTNVLGHKEFSHNATPCPGSEWLEGKQWRATLIAEIARVQSGIAPYHYVLFQSEEEMAATMEEARPYFDAFKPVAGTFLEDALQARYVTLVGSGTGPTAEAERRLGDAGVEFDRLGDSAAISATERFLQLAYDGRRFRTLLEP